MLEAVCAFLLVTGVPPDLDGARFFGRTWSRELPLDVSDFVVFVETDEATARSRLILEISNPSYSRVEAVLRLPTPPGAAVTRAVLYMGERPMAGHLMSSDIAHDAYRTITDKQLDPALVAWSGPDAIDISIFPVEPMGRRRFELEWTEPAAVAYRLPVIAERGRVIGRPSMVVVDGAFTFPQGREWIPLETTAATRAPNGQAPPLCPAVFVAETSIFTTAEERNREIRLLEQALEHLGPSCRVMLMANDGIGDVVWDAPARMRDEWPYLGAIDLDRLLESAVAHATTIGAHRIFLFGRGFAGLRRSEPLLADFRRQQVALVVLGTGPIDPKLYDLALRSGGLASDLSRPANTLAATLEFASRRTLPPPDALPLETVTGEVLWMNRPRPGASTWPLWARAQAFKPSAGPPSIITPEVSILVLEQEADYARWRRQSSDPPVRHARLGARIARAPALVMAAEPIVRGALDKYSLRRYIKHHVAEVRHCYEQELITNRKLQGRIVLQLVIDSSLGGPAQSVTVSSFDAAVDTCIVEHARRWEFPRVSLGGMVEVHYPFVLKTNSQ